MGVTSWRQLKIGDTHVPDRLTLRVRIDFLRNVCDGKSSLALSAAKITLMNENYCPFVYREC